ncbi:MAG: EAL domain-containing protein [Pseudomonadota bacterium]|nr:EAL domain-containing protein [Pseudomonadota bacterium]
MSLHRQMVLLITGLLLVLLAGICYLSVRNSRDYLEMQMHSHAQDTATSLGLSLSRPLGQDDLAMVQTMVDAIFDRGDFAEIVLRNPDGDVITRRSAEAPPHLVPPWFVAWLEINPMPGISEITEGWRRVGEVRVYADKDAANRNLWVAAKQAFWLFLFVGGVSWVVILMIVRAVLTPLRTLEKQAELICNKDFTGQQPLPKTRELKRVVQAINRMTRQLKVLFDEQVAQIEQVRNQAYVDSITGLGNGRFFNAQLQARLESPEEPFSGVLVRLQVKGMGDYNEHFGHDAGNLVLRRIGQVWQQTLEAVEGHCVARVTGTRFAALLPHQTVDKVKTLLEAAIGKMQRLDGLNLGGSSVQLYAGLSLCKLGDDPKLLEAQAAAALERAQSYQSGQVEVYDERDHGDALAPSMPGVSNWASFLEEVISNKKVVLHYQPVISCVDQSLMHHEVLARVAVDGKLVTAGHFIPLVERFDMVSRFDRMIIELLIEQLKSQQNGKRAPLAVNLSSHSVREDDFDTWLLAILRNNPDVAPYLIFEVPELTVRTAHGKLRRLAVSLKELGAKLTIDHFGTTNSSFGYLSGLQLYSIKVDSSYIRDIEDNLDHQFFVQSLVRIAHSRQILLTAEMVEGEAQWNLLRRFQLDGAQGYFLGQPQADREAA